MKIKEFFKTKIINRKPMKTKTRLIVLGIIVGLFLLFFFLRYIPGYSEGYTRTVSRFFQVVNGTIFSWIPTSIFEIIVIIIAISIVVWLISFIIKTAKKGIKVSYVKFINLGIVLASCFFIYAITIAPNYKRDPLEIPLQTTLIENVEEYYDIGIFFQNDFNELASNLNYNSDGSMVMPCSKEQLYDDLKYEYSKLNSDYYLDYSANPKPMYLLSWFYTQLQISGVTFPVTGEPSYNVMTPVCELPFTIAHEMAHTKGVMREEDANLLAAYICLNSNNSYIRYSGYINTYTSLYSLVRATNDDVLYNDFCNGLDQRIINNIYYVNNFWDSHNLFKSISVFFNDLYLLISQSNTTDAYVDHGSSGYVDHDGQQIYIIKEYSPYQGLLINYYYNH